MTTPDKAVTLIPHAHGRKRNKGDDFRRVLTLGIAATLCLATLTPGYLLATQAFRQKSAQKPSQMLPPVHLSPKPRYEHRDLGYGQNDPGLHRSLNGRSNPTHKIRNDSNAGRHMRISDTRPLEQSITSKWEKTERGSRNRLQDKITQAIYGKKKKQASSNPKQPTLSSDRQRYAATKQSNKNRRSIGTTFYVPKLNHRPDVTAFEDTRRNRNSTKSVSRSPFVSERNLPKPVKRSQFGSLMTRAIPDSYESVLERDVANASESFTRMQTKAQRIAKPDVEVVAAQEPVDDPFGDLDKIRKEFLKSQAANERARPTSVMSRPTIDLSPELESSPDSDGFDEPGFLPSNDLRNVPTHPVRHQFETELPELGEIENQNKFRSEFSGLENSRQDVGDEDIRSAAQSCDEYRKSLLDNPITGIALDISPLGNGHPASSSNRIWTDQQGAELATGKMVELRRGYVLVQTDTGMVKLPHARLCDADWAVIAETWKIPVECGLGPGNYVRRNWVPQTFTWKASALCHKPLYFENVALERYGHSYGPFLQPVESTIHFFGSLVMMPYNMSFNPPRECQYALGYYRPGNCAPWLKYPFPISSRGFNRRVLDGYRWGEVEGY